MTLPAATVAAMPEPRVLATRRYSEIKRLRRAGAMARADAPCDVTPCPAVHDPYRRVYVYDHCHAHDYIRGVVCGYCNHQMEYVDARVLNDRPGNAALITHWHRCPACAASGLWEPWLTMSEYLAGLIGIPHVIAWSRAEPQSAEAAVLWEVVCSWADKLLIEQRRAARRPPAKIERYATRLRH